MTETESTIAYYWSPATVTADRLAYPDWPDEMDLGDHVRDPDGVAWQPADDFAAAMDAAVNSVGYGFVARRFVPVRVESGGGESGGGESGGGESAEWSYARAPAGGWAETVEDAALRMLDESDLRPADIAEYEVSAGPHIVDAEGEVLASGPQPTERRAWGYFEAALDAADLPPETPGTLYGRSEDGPWYDIAAYEVYSRIYLRDGPAAAQAVKTAIYRYPEAA